MIAARAEHLALMIGLVLLPAPLLAQQLGAGSWRGMLELPDGDSLQVAVTVTRPRGRPQIDMRQASGLSWGMGGVREKDGRVEFSWALDGPAPLLCRLSFRSDALWEGSCDDTVRGEDGKFLRLLMTLRR